MKRGLSKTVNAGGPLLLDTHVWFWLVTGEDRFSQPALRLLERGATAGTLRVSVISAWEVSMLHARGRIRLHRPCLEWVRDALTLPGIALADLTPEIAVESNLLPGAFHGDPADRILVATAKLSGATLVTRDELILEYGRAGHLEAHPI